MNEEYYLGDLSYDLVCNEYSFKKNEKIEDLSLYPAEFYGLFNRKIREVQSDVIREFIVDKIIPYNRMNLDCYLEYYNLEYWNEWEIFLVAKGEKIFGLVIEMRGALGLLIDGHHKASACYLEGQPITCITIVNTFSYKNFNSKEEGIFLYW